MNPNAPHHDGSPTYVSEQAPTLGQRVSVRVRVPRAYPSGAVFVRTAPDGEQEFTAAHICHEDAVAVWWQAELHCHNPVTNYRFLLAADGPAGGYFWLNGSGMHPRDVPDAADFRLVTYPSPPEWSRNSVVYQVFPDRFARDVGVEPDAGAGTPLQGLPDWALPAAWSDDVASGPAQSKQFYGGTLNGVTEHLDHLVDLGVDVLYLTPFFPATSNHRYDAANFDQVDPLLGGDEALIRLQTAAHQRGIRVMGDITTNHTGDAHEWFSAASADPEGEAGQWYVSDPERGWISWLGVGSLPKLDYTHDAVRAAMYDDEDSAIQRWLGPGRGLDAWRVDVANMTGRYQDTDLAHEVARGVRAAVESAGQRTGIEPLLVGEHTHDHSADALGDGWHGVMNYSGFARPVWTWLRHPNFEPKFLGAPVKVPSLDGALVAETMREFTAIVPWRTVQHSFTLLGSHDTTRVRTLVGDDPKLIEVAAGLLFTLPGTPMMTYGDEIGMPGDFGEAGRRPMPWGAQGSDSPLWDENVRTAYRDLISLRRSTPSLSEGGLRWLAAEGNALIFVREHPTGSSLVHIARAAHDPIEVPQSALLGVESGFSAYGCGPAMTSDKVIFSANGPSVALWHWQQPVPPWS